CIVLWDKDGNPEIVQADSRPFAIETNAVEYDMYEQALGPLRFIQKDEEMLVTSQEDDVTPELLNALFDTRRPRMVALAAIEHDRHYGSSSDGV
ncbi:hypothetical protein Droror1_Dr00023400, partial [Drosera rotundifolia]